MFEVTVYEQSFRIVSVDYSVNHVLDVITLQFWKKEAMQIHLLLESQMQIRYYHGRDIPKVYAMEFRNEDIFQDLYLLQQDTVSLVKVKFC